MTTASVKPITVCGVPLSKEKKTSTDKVQVDLDNLGEIFVTEDITTNESTADDRDH